MLKTIPELIGQVKASIAIVTATDVAAFVNQKSAVLIDVREPAEFEQKSAVGALNIPRGLLEMKVLQLYPDAEKTIYLHCATGARAILSAEQLKRVGYVNVSVITDSLDDICHACS